VKVLLDACVWCGSRVALESAGHDVEWVGDWPQDPGDDEILAISHRGQQVMVTLDKDFGERAVVRGQLHAGIIRLVDIAARDQGLVCARVLERYADDLQAGAIVTVQPGRVRIRRASSPSTGG
jgi:predicted nuclease of predicted toxin-antitoxin system